MTKFDGNLAWKQASASVKANRDLLLALAGVFFFLPGFALIMLFKQPQVPPGAKPEQVLALLEPFMVGIMPWLLVGSVVQALGQLTLIELFGRGERATVGEALRRSLPGLPSYVAVQLLTGFMAASVLFLTMAIVGVINPALGFGVAFYAVCQAYGRLLIAGAVVALEGQRNPFVAILRSLSLSHANGFRIGNFLFLLAMAVFVLFVVATIVIGIAAVVTLGEGRMADIIAGFFSSVVTAFAATYFIGITVAVYRQLAGDAPAAAGGPSV